MKGYPRGQLTKKDYENLRSMPEYASQANASMNNLFAIKDEKIDIETGTNEKSCIVTISNQLPMWKKVGFKDKKEIQTLLGKTDDIVLKDTLK